MGTFCPLRLLVPSQLLGVEDDFSLGCEVSDHADLHEDDWYWKWPCENINHDTRNREGEGNQNAFKRGIAPRIGCLTWRNNWLFLFLHLCILSVQKLTESLLVGYRLVPARCERIPQRADASFDKQRTTIDCDNSRHRGVQACCVLLPPLPHLPARSLLELQVSLRLAVDNL